MPGRVEAKENNMADGTYKSKVYRKQGGDEIVVASGGILNIETGGLVYTNGAQGAALTAALTTMTSADTNSSPDYALSALTTTSPYGLATQAEAISFVYAVINAQTRLAEIEARLEAAGIVAAN